MSKSIEIFINNNNYNYPRISNLDNETFFIFDNDLNFVNYILNSFKKNIFFCEYDIEPDNMGTLEIRIKKSSYFINRYITTEEFISSGYPIHWCKKLVDFSHTVDFDKIKILDILHNNNEWKRITLLLLPPMKDSNYESFITNPFVLGPDHTVFKNLILRSYINCLIFNSKISSLNKLLDFLIKPSIKKIKILINNNSDDIKLVTLCYDRNKFNAFIYAWFNNQIGDNKKENEKIQKGFKTITSIL
ncbi:virion assembly protein [Brazilian porcupinepox virus 1]|nr:virion assembly protein [Brazilian porcupinepox virus 1]